MKHWRKSAQGRAAKDRYKDNLERWGMSKDDFAEVKKIVRRCGGWMRVLNWKEQHKRWMTGA